MKKNKFRIILTCVGVLLILCAAGLLIFSRINTKSAQVKAGEIVTKMYSLMPDVRSGAPDDRSNTTMPMLEIDGNNFIGIIEAPQYGKTLPIYGKWEASRVSDYPCRYTGSMYNSSLIIGGSDNKGQFDFVKTISNGDTILITDTTGLRYKYIVSDIKRTNDVSSENLTGYNADLTLFARNTYSLDYTVILCTLA